MGIEKGFRTEQQTKAASGNFNPDKRIETASKVENGQSKGGDHLVGITETKRGNESFAVDEKKSSESYNPDKKLEINQKSEHMGAELYDPDKKVDAAKEFCTNYDERLQHVPRSGGEWAGERGESKFIPDSEATREKLKEFGMDGIEYKNAIPDFSKVAKETVRIDMTSDRDKNFKQCDSKCAEKWNRENHDGRSDWTAREVSDWRKENEYSWHEGSDRETCQLVPRAIHDACKHIGGIGECKRFEKKEEEDEFDA